MDNKCGGCTLCCKVFAIKEIEKPQGKWCPHCKPGKGCSIYKERPMPCATFECAWLQSQKQSVLSRFPERMRPDKCKVVITMNAAGHAVAVPDTGYPEAWREPELLGVLKGMGKINGGKIGIDRGPLRPVLLLTPEGALYEGRGDEKTDEATGERSYSKWTLIDHV